MSAVSFLNKFLLIRVFKRKEFPKDFNWPFPSDYVPLRLNRLRFLCFQPKKQMKFSESVIKTGEGLLAKS